MNLPSKKQNDLESAYEQGYEEGYDRCYKIIMESLKKAEDRLNRKIKENQTNGGN